MVIDDNDRMVIGNAMPDVTGGLNTTVTWKNLSLYLGFYYSLGGQIYNAAEHNRNMFKYTELPPSPKSSIICGCIRVTRQSIRVRIMMIITMHVWVTRSIGSASFIRLQNCTYSL